MGTFLVASLGIFPVTGGVVLAIFGSGGIWPRSPPVESHLYPPPRGLRALGARKVGASRVPLPGSPFPISPRGQGRPPDLAPIKLAASLALPPTQNGQTPPMQEGCPPLC